MLFELTPLDTSTFGAVAALSVLVALLASYVPAARASRKDPLVALRHDSDRRRAHHDAETSSGILRWRTHGVRASGMRGAAGHTAWYDRSPTPQFT
jgi:hypothetical protein